MRVPFALLCLLLPGLAHAEAGFVQGLIDGQPVCLIAASDSGRLSSLGELEMAPAELGPRDWWVVSLAGLAGAARGGAPVMAECGCIEQPVVNLTPAPGLAGHALASNLPQSQPAKLQQLAVDSAAYVKAIEALLVQHQLPDAPVRLTHVLRTDFEGDGVDEVLLAGAWTPYQDGAQPADGYYSFLLLRKLVNGQVVTSEVEAWWLPTPPADATEAPMLPASIEPVALLDVDGDGRMELVAAAMGHEYLAYDLYRLAENRLERVASCGCGC